MLESCLHNACSIVELCMLGIDQQSSPFLGFSGTSHGGGGLPVAAAPGGRPGSPARRRLRPHPPAALARSNPSVYLLPAAPLPSPAQTASTLRIHSSVWPVYPPTASHEPSPVREPVSRPMSPLARPWSCPAPSLPTPSPACQPVRYLSGSQLLTPVLMRTRPQHAGHSCTCPTSVA